MCNVNDGYIQNKEYNNKDIICVAILYIIIIAMYTLFGELVCKIGTDVLELHLFCGTGIFSIIIIGLVLIICKVRKQKLSTIGLSKINAKKSFITGVKYSLIAGAIIVYSSAIYGDITIRNNIVTVIMRLIYFLFFISFCEELVFRGYIGTRLKGYFKSELLSEIITGVMFSMAHIPFHMIVSKMGFIDYIGTRSVDLIVFVLFHFIFQRLYNKYSSIIAPTIVHFVWDFLIWFLK